MKQGFIVYIKKSFSTRSEAAKLIFFNKRYYVGGFATLSEAREAFTQLSFSPLCFLFYVLSASLLAKLEETFKPNSFAKRS